MSTPPLSPIEQLMQMPAQPAQKLSPLEQLGQSVEQEKQQTPQSKLSPLELLGQSVEQEKAAPQKTPDEQASDTRQMLVSGLTGMPTPNMTDADKASFENGKAAGAGTATLLSSAPLLVDAAITHLGSLTKIVQAAKTLGWTSFGIKEAHDIYKMVSGGNSK